MYRYDEFDEQFVHQRAQEFRQQAARRISGELSEDEFRPLRLMNGLYLQLHAYMLRVAIPYGTINSEQLHKLADISEKYDRGYGHFTTRQNIQFNWIQLDQTADILDELATVEMHAIQTSGNCIRNVTTDPWAGVAKDEDFDPRTYAEFIRQWSSLHPEFSFLPRKFKIAITGSSNDRAAIRVHDIGLQLIKKDDKIGFAVYIGGGQGRTPMIAPLLKDWVSEYELLDYLIATLRVYNEYGRRDNKYKARIKILVHETGIDKLKKQIENEFANIRQINSTEKHEIERSEIKRIHEYFKAPDYIQYSDQDIAQQQNQIDELLSQSPQFKKWYKNNTNDHKVDGYRIVNISLKPIGGIPGDASTKQIHEIARLTKEYSLDEARITHRQNVVLPYVSNNDLFALWEALTKANLAETNYEMATDIIACPGLDYCALATAKSIPIAQTISEALNEDKYLGHAGNIHINISGCINACGHHHVANIGILGLNKNGEEFYQLTLGGSNQLDAKVGERFGPGFSEEDVPKAVKKILDTFLEIRISQEKFIDTFNRVGIKPFKEAVYVD